MQDYPDQEFLSMILLTIRSACANFFPLSDNLRVSAGFTRIERVAYWSCSVLVMQGGIDPFQLFNRNYWECISTSSCWFASSFAQVFAG
jgi:hypothetical protein